MLQQTTGTKHEMHHWEIQFTDFVQKHIVIIGLAACTFFSLLLRFSCFHFQSEDYKQALLPWMTTINQYGGFGALKQNIGDYNIPYVFILSILSYLPHNALKMIKMVSVLFDYTCAVGLTLIVKELMPHNKLALFLSYSISTFLPTVVLNSAFWAQCDSIYAAFLIFSIWQALKDHYSASFVLFGLALSFKLQAIFLFPLFIILYFANRRFSVLKFLWIPFIYLVTLLPAVMAGRPFLDILKVYQTQAGEFPYITLNYPNFYILVPGTYRDLKNFAILLTAGLFVILFTYVIHKKCIIDSTNLISFALLTIFICVYFLPCMHERYGFLMDLLSLVYAILIPKRAFMAIGINLISLLAYSKFLFQSGFPAMPLALFNTLLLILLAYFTIKDFNKKAAEESKAASKELPGQA